MGRLKDQYEVLVTLEGDCMDLYRKGLQKFYKGILKGKDSDESFLLGLEQRCNLESKIVVACLCRCPGSLTDSPTRKTE